MTVSNQGDVVKYSVGQSDAALNETAVGVVLLAPGSTSPAGSATNPLSISNSSSTIATNQATVSTTATSIAAARTGRRSITIVNGPLIIVGQGPFPQIIAGFTDIISTATTAIAQMQGTPPVTTQADASAIADAFREFVRVHQVLLNILIGKAGLFQTVPFIGQPVAAVLRQIESVVDVSHPLPIQACAC